MKASQNIDIGKNVRDLRQECGMSTDDLIARMNRLGYNWNRTTLFNVEHNMRRLQLQGGYDILKCLNLDPLKDMPLLCRKDNPPLSAIAHWKREQYADKLHKAWNEYLESSELYERLLDYDEKHGYATPEWTAISRGYFSSIDESFRAAVADNQPDRKAGEVHIHDFPKLPSDDSKTVETQTPNPSPNNPDQPADR